MKTADGLGDYGGFGSNDEKAPSRIQYFLYQFINRMYFQACEAEFYKIRLDFIKACYFSLFYLTVDLEWSYFAAEIRPPGGA